jgi:hypothetical protein
MLGLYMHVTDEILSLQPSSELTGTFHPLHLSKAAQKTVNKSSSYIHKKKNCIIGWTEITTTKDDFVQKVLLRLTCM